MSIPNIAEIVKSVGGDPKKRATLIIVMMSLIIMTAVGKWVARGDCDPLIKQNEQLLRIQKTLTEQNQSIIERNRDLSEGYLQIQNMLTQIRPDTVYITIQSPPSEYRISSVDTIDGSHRVYPITSLRNTAEIKTVRRTSHGYTAIQNLKKFVGSKLAN